MSDLATVGKEATEELLHFGVKGMKWGVRRKQKKLDKADARLRKTVSGSRSSAGLRISLHNAVLTRAQVRAGDIDAKSEYQKAFRDGRLTNPEDPITKKYLTEQKKAYIDTLNEYASTLQSPSGKLGIKVVGNDVDGYGPGAFEVQIVEQKAKHADEAMTYVVQMSRDESGRVIGFEFVDTTIQQGEDFTAALVHYGVKGMKWGVRRRQNRSSTVTVSKSKATGSIKTRGGAGRKPSADATKAAVSRQIAKKSGHQALSNDELKQLVERMDLEKRANRHAAEGLGAQFVKALLDKQK
jgi:hypothetical protein